MPAEPPKRKLRPARIQVQPGDVDLSEKVQPGKEYSEWTSLTLLLLF